MNEVSLNNLWNYLSGLSLSEQNRHWLANKLMHPTPNKEQTVQNMKKYRISPKRKELLGSLEISNEELREDERLKQILR